MTTDEGAADLDAWLDGAMPRIYGLAYALTGDSHAAQDLSQEALATVVSKWRTVSRAQNTTAYARQIVVNMFLSQKRKRWSREVISDVVVTGWCPRCPTMPTWSSTATRSSRRWVGCLHDNALR